MMVPFKETIKTKQELIDACRKGFDEFCARRITKNDFLMYFGFTHGEAIRKFYRGDYEQLLLDGGFNSGSSAYFSAGINAWKNLSDGIYEFPPFEEDKPIRRLNFNLPLQQIFYGAPGTGKSHKVNETICNLPKENVFRTTFHPDSDYSTFVGCYKPTKESVKLRDVTGKTIKDNVEGKEVDVTENRITYEFVPQVFTKAYVRAYKTDGPVFLVIEEINRGNCAQIFGDIFQLLDRDDCGVSAYAVKPDSDLENYLMEQLGDKYDPNEGMRLPNNLHIWATMNTSDQSLFPIDSAFKRRWDWVYVPIENHADKGYEIEVGNEKYDWWEFLDKMNERIYRATTSEDKKMGYFFVKLKKGEKKISEDVMVNKVLFYLFNDVFKDFDSEGLFKVDNKLMHFSDYHDKNNRSTLLKDLMSKLSLEPTNAESTQQAKQDNLDNTQN